MKGGRHVGEVALRAGFKPYILLLLLIWAMNLADSSLTLHWTTSGSARELNPIMALVLSLGPLPFFLIKLALGTAGVLFLWEARLARSVRGAALGVGLAYALVGGIHGTLIFLG